jgi:hypothetical protein
VTLAANGLLIEEQRTNLLTYSEDFSNAAWTKVAGSVSVSQNAVGPNGVSNSAATITALAGTNNHWLYQSFASSAIAYSQSVYAKAGTANWIGVGFGAGAITDGVFFNLSNGTVGTAAFGSTGTIQNAGNGWYRCTVTRTGPGGTYFGALEVHTADNQALNWNAAGTETISVFGLNMEAGSFATSYIPTVASQVTRAADNASMLGDNFATWFNASQGTLYTQVTPNAVPADVRFASVDDGTSANRILIWGSSSSSSVRYEVISGSVNQVGLTSSGTLISNSTFKAAATYALNDFAFSVNGGASLTDNAGILPVGVKSFVIGGSSGTVFGSNLIRSISYYPTRLPNATLVSITS